MTESNDLPCKGSGELKLVPKLKKKCVWKIYNFSSNLHLYDRLHFKWQFYSFSNNLKIYAELQIVTTRSSTHTPNTLPSIWIDLWIQKWFMAHIWSCGDLDLWPLDLKLSEMLNITPISHFHWQRLLPGTCDWNYGPKTEILPIFCLLALTFDL